METIIVTLITLFAPALLLALGLPNKDKRDVAIREIAEKLHMDAQVQKIDERRKERIENNVKAPNELTLTRLAFYYAAFLFIVGAGMILALRLRPIFERLLAQDNPFILPNAIIGTSIIFFVFWAALAIIPLVLRGLWSAIKWGFKHLKKWWRNRQKNDDQAGGKIQTCQTCGQPRPRNSPAPTGDNA